MCVCIFICRFGGMLGSATSTAHLPVLINWASQQPIFSTYVQSRDCLGSIFSKEPDEKEGFSVLNKAYSIFTIYLCRWNFNEILMMDLVPCAEVVRGARKLNYDERNLWLINYTYKVVGTELFFFWSCRLIGFRPDNCCEIPDTTREDTEVTRQWKCESDL